MLTRARFRKLALSLDGVTEVPHLARTAFRTRRAIIATLPPDGRSANLKLNLELQATVVAAAPHAFSPVPGGWGRLGYTTVDLQVVTEAVLVSALKEAHWLASAPPPRKKAKKPRP